MNSTNGINTRNYSQKTNFTCGSSTLDLVPFYVTTLNVPGITATIPEVSGRNGAAVNFAAANIAFNTLSLEIILDENYQVFKDVHAHMFVNVEEGSFECNYFDFWTEFTDDMGVTVMKIEYYSCQVESIGELSLATNDDTTEQMFTLDLKYDYYKIIYNDVPTLRV